MSQVKRIKRISKRAYEMDRFWIEVNYILSEPEKVKALETAVKYLSKNKFNAQTIFGKRNVNFLMRNIK